jgi:hypothetical protein
VLHAGAERTDQLSKYSRRDHSARSESNQRTQLCSGRVADAPAATDRPDTIGASLWKKKILKQQRFFRQEGTADPATALDHKFVFIAGFHRLLVSY